MGITYYINLMNTVSIGFTSGVPLTLNAPANLPSAQVVCGIFY